MVDPSVGLMSDADYERQSSSVDETITRSRSDDRPDSPTFEHRARSQRIQTKAEQYGDDVSSHCRQLPSIQHSAIDSSNADCPLRTSLPTSVCVCTSLPVRRSCGEQQTAWLQGFLNRMQARGGSRSAQHATSAQQSERDGKATVAATGEGQRTAHMHNHAGCAFINR